VLALQTRIETLLKRAKRRGAGDQEGRQVRGGRGDDGQRGGFSQEKRTAFVPLRNLTLQITSSSHPPTHTPSALAAENAAGENAESDKAREDRLVEERRRIKDLENRAVSLIIKGFNDVARLNALSLNTSSSNTSSSSSASSSSSSSSAGNYSRAKGAESSRSDQSTTDARRAVEEEDEGGAGDSLGRVGDDREAGHVLDRRGRYYGLSAAQVSNVETLEKALEKKGGKKGKNTQRHNSSLPAGQHISHAGPYGPMPGGIDAYIGRHPSSWQLKTVPVTKANEISSPPLPPPALLLSLPAL
jgi:hypothetical protein